MAKFASIGLTIQREICCMQISGDIEASNLQAVFNLGFTYAPQTLLVFLDGYDNQQYLFSQANDLSDLNWVHQALNRFEPWELQEGILRSPRPATTRMNSIIQSVHAAKRELIAA